MDFSEVIQYYEKLCKERPGSAWWAENIIDSEKRLVKGNDHANFYRYLTNPGNFKYEQNVEVLGDIKDSALQKIENDLQNMVCGEQVTRIYKNGSDRVVIIEDEKESL